MGLRPVDWALDGAIAGVWQNPGSLRLTCFLLFSECLPRLWCPKRMHCLVVRGLPTVSPDFAMFHSHKSTFSLACVAALMMLGGCSVLSFIAKEKATKTSDFTVPIPESGKCFIRSQNGSIRCVSGPVAEIEVKAEITARAATVEQAEALLDQISIDRTETDGAVEIVASVPRGVSGSVSFQVIVPHQTDLDLETSNGTIEVTGVAGHVTCKTSNGTASVIDGAGSVDVKTSNGKIVLESESLANVKARTSNGSVQLKGDLLPGAHEIHTSNGSIRVELYGTPVTVTATTSNGSITADGQKLKKGQPVTLGGVNESTDPAIAQLSLRTSNGSIKIVHQGASEEPAASDSAEGDVL